MNFLIRKFQKYYLFSMGLFFFGLFLCMALFNPPMEIPPGIVFWVIITIIISAIFMINYEIKILEEKIK